MERLLLEAHAVLPKSDARVLSRLAFAFQDLETVVLHQARRQWRRLGSLHGGVEVRNFVTVLPPLEREHSVLCR